MTTVTVRDLTVGYGRKPVLDGLCLDIPSGGLTAVLGASGSGKTTLLRVLAGFLKPDRGMVRFGGRTVVSAGLGDGDVFVPPEKRRVGIVPQEGALFPHLSVAANVGFGLPRGSGSRIDHALRLVGMADRAGARPQELSGGQQQRVALARALAPQPDVILLDEPFSSLDAALRADLRTEVAELLRSAGSTAVLVTHDQEEALSIADHVAVMRDGRVVQAGSPGEVYDTPADLGVARFLGEVVELPATTGAAPDAVSCALGQVPVHPGAAPPVAGPAVVVLRPEQLLLQAAAPPSPRVADTGHGVVRDAAFYGHDSLLRIELADGSRVPVRVPGGARVPRPGDRVAIEVRGAGHLFPA